MTKEQLVELRKRYTEPEVPPCRVCGGPLSLQAIGGGPTVWACAPYEDDPEKPGLRRPVRGRILPDEHYSNSQHYQYQHGDERVLALINDYERLMEPVVVDVPPVDVVRGKGVRFTVPGHYGDQEIDGLVSWPNFERALVAARSTLKRYDYTSGIPSTFSRACVALRMSSNVSDREVLRWEVFPDRVVLVPAGQGGLSDEQAKAALAMRLP